MKKEEKNLTGYPSIDKPWLKYYSEEAIGIRNSECSIYQNIYDGNYTYHNDVALLYFGKKITYGKLFKEIDKVAKALIKYGVKCGDNVAVCMPAIPETIYLILALNKIGANANMLNPLFSEEQLTARINDTGAELLFTINELYIRVEKVVTKTTIKTVVCCTSVNSLGAVVKIIKKAKSISDTIPWNIFIKSGKGLDVIVPAYKPNRPAIMVYSSGTTGASKGIQLTNDSINNTIYEGVQIGFDWKRSDKWLAVVPIWFSTGVCASILVPLKYGITVILEPQYDFDIFYKHIVKYKPNFMIAANATLAYLMEKHPKAEAYKEFKFLCAGGEYVTKSAENNYNEWLKNNGNTYGFFKGYGMCECGGTVTASSPKCNVLGSAGIPTPNVVVAAFDLESGKELQYGERGELRVITPCRMLGYYKNREVTEKFFYEDEQGRLWACTGDMGYVTEDGCVYVDGRISSSYKNNASETIYLFDIERTILEIEQVRQCKVVVSEVDGRRKHIAHMVLVDLTDISKTLEKIKQHCSQRLKENHLPTLVKLYDSALPVAPSGKLDITAMEKDALDLINI